MAANQVLSELPSNYKTCILKVSIHCEGCKKKVKKILTNIPGVHNVDIETKQQKVIVTSTVEPETLLKKLIKSGKHADFWPENPDRKEKQKPPKEPQNDPQINKDAAAHPTLNADKDLKPPQPKVEKPQDSTKIADPVSSSGVSTVEIPAPKSQDTKIAGKFPAVEVAGKFPAGEKAVETSKSEENLPETVLSGSPSPAKMAGGSEVGADKSDGGDNGNGSKKKKKKGQNGNKTPPPAPPPPTSSTSDNHDGGPPPTSNPANHSPPRQQGYNNGHPPPAHYYMPPPYGVSYNMAHPSSIQTTSYYAAQPPSSYTYSHPGSGREPPFGYAHSGSVIDPPGSVIDPPGSDRAYAYPYMYPGSGMENPRVDLDGYPRQPLDSFEMFSDENPNGCSIS